MDRKIAYTEVVYYNSAGEELGRERHIYFGDSECPES